MAQEPTIPSQIEQAVRHALTSMLNDSAFTRHLAEEIADKLDGFSDDQFAATLKEAENSPLVSEDDIQNELKR